MLERKRPVLVSSLPSLGVSQPAPLRESECPEEFLSRLGCTLILVWWCPLKTSLPRDVLPPRSSCRMFPPEPPTGQGGNVQLIWRTLPTSRVDIMADCLF
jgi:hypothetical protein